MKAKMAIKKRTPKKGQDMDGVGGWAWAWAWTWTRAGVGRAGVLDCKWERLRGASGSNHRHCESQASSDAMNTIYESIITTTMLSFFFLLFLL